MGIANIKVILVPIKEVFRDINNGDRSKFKLYHPFIFCKNIYVLLSYLVLCVVMSSYELIISNY